MATMLKICLYWNARCKNSIFCLNYHKLFRAVITFALMMYEIRNSYYEYTNLKQQYMVFKNLKPHFSTNTQTPATIDISM